MKNLLITSLFFALSSSLFAQAKIEFKKTTHDFGAIEEGQKATYVFHFKNIGDDTLQLKSVKPSCGCTSPYWVKAPVLPGETGEIKVLYNSKNRPGQFIKTINIVSNASTTTMRLKIKGVVLDAKSTTISKDSIAKSAQIYIKKTTFVLGEIEKRKTETLTILIENKGSVPLKIKRTRAGCGCVHPSTTNFVVEAGQSKPYTLNFTPNALGDFSATTIIESNDPTNPYFTINIKATVKTTLKQENLLQTNSGSGF